MNSSPPRFKRVLLKISGEALMGDESFGISPRVLKKVAAEIAAVHDLGVQMAIVIGGGNIFRGLQAETFGVGRTAADHMGMLATVINTLALGEALQGNACESRIMTAIDIIKVAEPYIRERAIRHLNRGRIVLFGAGTGNPYFTTDTAAALRAVEIEAEVLLKATKVDGVYPADPEKQTGGKPFKKLSYKQVLSQNLKVMDLTAVSLAMGQGLPIIVFNLRKKGNVLKVISQPNIGTLIAGEEP